MKLGGHVRLAVPKVGEKFERNRPLGGRYHIFQACQRFFKGLSHIRTIFVSYSRTPHSGQLYRTTAVNQIVC